MKCPKCASENWKLASLVYSEGLTSIDTSSSGSTLGVGVGTGGVGVGYARSGSDTTGSHQTKVSQSAAPPEVPPHPGIKMTRESQESIVGTFQFLVGVGAVIWLFSQSIWLGGVALVLLIAYWGKLKASLANNRAGEYKEYEAKYARQLEEHQTGVEARAQWERTGICQRCGYRFSIDG